MAYSERVLFVDDDPLSRRAFARAMRQCGFIIDVAENGEEALDLAEHYPYAVLAADWRMPGVDGLKLVEHVRTGDSDPVCLLVTGATESEIDEVDLPTLGISALIRKPWESTALAEVLQGALNNYHDRRRMIEPGSLEAQAFGVPILLVESDPKDALQVQTLLEEAAHGLYQVSWVQSMEDAAQHLAKESIHAILVSLNLPDSVGVEAVRRLLHMGNNAPVLALSGTRDETLSLTAVQAGAQDYLFKSQLERDGLNRAIQHAIERKRAEERLTHMAHHDQLTGLANRTLLSERLKQAVSRGKRQSSLVAVFFLDLDRFKAVNDTLGHDAGDQLLKQVALRLTGSVRETDTVARLGGDEFAIVLEGLVGSREATLLAQRVLNSFATPFRLDAGEVVTTTSVGIALYPHNGGDVDELLKSADSAMYRAKETGRDNYQFFSEEIHARAIRQIELESSLRVASENERFVVFYQPQVDATTHEVVSVESLVRWKDSGRLIPPAEFMPVLEESGLILPVGSWVMKKTCAQLKAWNSSSELNLRASVNVSVRQFEAPGFVEDVRGALAQHGVSGSSLELEITEGVLMRDTERTRQSFAELAALGVRISIDDFGTGYSSLAYLKRFPIDGLKIDSSFIENVTRSEDDAALASAIIGLGRSLGLSVVAEGVETSEQLAFLREQGCDFVQGFLVARPADAAETTGWLKQTLKQGGIWNADQTRLFPADSEPLAKPQSTP